MTKKQAGKLGARARWNGNTRRGSNLDRWIRREIHRRIAPAVKRELRAEIARILKG